MTAQKSHADIVLSYFRKQNTAKRLEIMRRNVDDMESMVLGLQAQLAHVKQTRAEVMGMIDIMAADLGK